MACTSCGIMGGFEHYTNAAESVPKAPGQSGSCPAKDLMNTCLYTAQGVLICDAPKQAQAPTKEAFQSGPHPMGTLRLPK